MIWSVACNVLTVPVCNQSIRAWAVSEGSCDLRLSLSSWLGWSIRASLRSSANWTTCSGPALTGEPRSYMLLENSTAAAFEPEECVDEEERLTQCRAIINTIIQTLNVTAIWSSSISCITSQFARGPRMELWILLKQSLIKDTHPSECFQNVHVSPGSFPWQQHTHTYTHTHTK